MKRVLIISTVGLIYDGITNVITSYLETMDLSNLDVRVVGTIKIEPSIRKKIENCGCKIVELPDRKKDTLNYFIELWKYIRREKVEVIHAHGNSRTLSVEMFAGYLGGAMKRIAHSHNTKCDQVKANKLLRPMFNHLYTDALACGEEAGKWLFGDKPFKVLTNGRNVEKYKFSPTIRKQMRKKYKLTDELVIGHVGGFVKQKNHAFLIKIFRKVLKEKTDARLFLIGDGLLRKEIEYSAEDIKESIVFVGNTDLVEYYLQLMDIMVLPSLFEGLPLVVIEWQINGLPCLISDTITKDCAVSNLVSFFAIDDGTQKWADTILKCTEFSRRKEQSAEAVKKVISAGFDINENAKELNSIYLNELHG